MRQPFETMPTVLTAEEIVGKMMREAERAETEVPRRLPALVKAKRREVVRVKASEQASAGYLEGLVRSVPTIERLHPFYREILELASGVAVVKAALGRLSRAARIIRELAKEAGRQIRYSKTPQEAGRARRAFLGRAASIIRGEKDDLELIAGMREKMKGLPAADPSVPTVVLAGYPGVGKSTILRSISRARPEVRPYPFTTKEVIIGHAQMGGLTVQVVDTPGLLDRPLGETNQIEKLSITALKNLANLIVFIVDASEANGFSLESQRSLFDGITSNFPGIPVLTFLNKVDASSEEQISRASMLFSLAGSMSAAKGDGIDSFMELVARELSMEGAPRRVEPS
ncbi:MAG: 50S ribosome-binding GTPase [Candidatus Verstraetearchaeota archaeon]|nr:50S ribosome-binding GTPase [Candidatus Verstraetearchaeota archaeon]